MMNFESIFSARDVREVSSVPNSMEYYYKTFSVRSASQKLVKTILLDDFLLQQMCQ